MTFGTVAAITVPSAMTVWFLANFGPPTREETIALAIIAALSVLNAVLLRRYGSQ